MTANTETAEMVAGLRMRLNRRSDLTDDVTHAVLLGELRAVFAALDAAEQRALSERNKALEEAANVADELQARRTASGHTREASAARTIAASIRALQNGGGDA